jgi:glycosyltransferase involved in cell wall biosynthesis
MTGVAKNVGGAQSSDELLVVSSWAPPTIGGTPTVLRNLLRALCARYPVKVEIVRQQVLPEACDGEWIWNTTTFTRPRAVASVRGGHYALAPRVFATVFRRVMARRHMLVLVTLPEESFALASALACRLARHPYALYMHNTYADQAVHWIDRLFAPIAEKWLLRGASPLLVLSDALRDLYSQKYGIESVVVRHVVDEDPFKSARVSDLPPGVQANRYALFTGDVYGMNADSLRRLVDVLRGSFSERLQTVVSGQKTREELAAMEIEPDVVLVGAAQSELVALQKHAAILLAPLAFESPFPSDVDTALPTKVIEYLVSGPPILVHAPSSSFLAERASIDGWAAVVSEPSDEGLRSAITRLLDDEEFVAHLDVKARDASRFYCAETAVEAFVSAVVEGVPPTTPRR